MASKAIYSVVATVGIATAAGAAYWYQNKSTGPKEITASGNASAPAGGASTGAPAGPPRGGGMPSVEVAKVEASRLQDDAQAVGSLRSKQNVMLRPEVSGRVQTLGFTDGGRVRRGDVIMQLEDGLQRAEVRQAEAQMSIARATLKRNQELVAQNFVAQRVVDESAAQMQVVEAQMSLACARWDRMRVVAPFDGTVGIRNVNIGDYVKDGADLVNLEDLSSMFVDFRLPERFVGRLRRDQAIEMQLDAMPGRQFKAKIDAIDPQLDANGRSVLIRAVLPNTSGEPLAQRPAGGPGGGQGGSGGAGSAAATGSGGRPVGAAPAGAKPADKPMSKPAARPPQRPTAAPIAAVLRPVDPMAVTCAQFSNTAVVARAASGAPIGSQTGVAGAAGATPGGRGVGAAAVVGAGGPRPTGAGGAGAPSAPRSAGAPAGARGGAPGGPGGSGAGASGAAVAGGGGGAPLRPGMFARVTTVFNIKEAALSVPEEAIVPQGGRQFVIRVVEQTEAQGKEIADKQAADAAKAAEVAKAAAAASSAPVSAGAAGGPGGAPGGVGGGAGGAGGQGGAQPYNMSGFVDGKRLVSQRQEVKLGIRRPGRVEITEGLSESDTVIVAGQQRVQRDNTPVRVVELGRAPGAPGGASSGAPGGAPNAATGGAANAAAGSVGGVGGAAPAMPAASTPVPAASR